MTADPRIEQIRALLDDWRDPDQVLEDIRAILDSPPPDSETEWGWKTRYRTYSATQPGQRGEEEARRIVSEGYKDSRVLVRREVGPWTEVQP